MRIQEKLKSCIRKESEKEPAKQKSHISCKKKMHANVVYLQNMIKAHKQNQFAEKKIMNCTYSSSMLFHRLLR